MITSIEQKKEEEKEPDPKDQEKEPDPNGTQVDKQISEKSPVYSEVLEIIDLLKQKSPQFNMDGERNIWIMKPAGSSRGRGICL